VKSESLVSAVVAAGLAALAEFGSALLLFPNTGRLKVFTPAGLGQDTRLLHHLVEAPQGLLEGLIRTNDYFRQIVLPLPWPGI